MQHLHREVCTRYAGEVYHGLAMQSSYQKTTLVAFFHTSVDEHLRISSSEAAHIVETCFAGPSVG